MGAVRLCFCALAGSGFAVRRYSMADARRVAPVAHSLLESASETEFPITPVLTGGLLLPGGRHTSGDRRHLALSATRSSAETRAEVAEAGKFAANTVEAANAVEAAQFVTGPKPLPKGLEAANTLEAAQIGVTGPKPLPSMLADWERASFAANAVEAAKFVTAPKLLPSKVRQNDFTNPALVDDPDDTHFKTTTVAPLEVVDYEPDPSPIPEHWPESWRYWIKALHPIETDNRRVKKYRMEMYTPRSSVVYQVAPSTEKEWAYWRKEVETAKRLGGTHFPRVFADWEIEDPELGKCILFCRDDGTKHTGTLADLIARDEGTVAMDVKVKIMLDVLEGVTRMAKLGYIHSHISPDAIVLVGNCQVPSKCRAQLDIFGYTHSIQRVRREREDNSMDRFDTYREYMPPEVAMRQSKSAHRDVWSLGVMFYELIFSGMFPLGMYSAFDSDEDFMFYLAYHVNISRDHDFMEFCKEHPHVARVLEHMMERDPETRWSASRALTNLKEVARTFPRLAELPDIGGNLAGSGSPDEGDQKEAA